MLDKFIPQKEVEFSKQYIALFQSNDFDSIETKINHYGLKVHSG